LVCGVAAGGSPCGTALCIVGPVKRVAIAASRPRSCPSKWLTPRSPRSTRCRSGSGVCRPGWWSTSTQPVGSELPACSPDMCLTVSRPSARDRPSGPPRFGTSRSRGEPGGHHRDTELFQRARRRAAERDSGCRGGHGRPGGDPGRLTGQRRLARPSRTTSSASGCQRSRPLTWSPAGSTGRPDIVSFG
jgi:hypothetical protein